MTTQQLIEQLKTEGGAIVASGDCTDTEIAVAQASGRFSADEHGFGYVRRPAIWLKINKNRELAHPNTDGRFGHNDQGQLRREEKV
jgi:hypothetical protein